MTLASPPETPAAPSSAGPSPLPAAPSPSPWGEPSSPPAALPPFVRWWLQRADRSDPVDEKARMTAQRQWFVYGGIGVAVAVLGAIASIDAWSRPAPVAVWLFALLAGGAVATMRFRPAVALVLAWAAGLVQVGVGVPLSVVELTVLAVLFFAARYGRLGVVIASGLTGPGAVMVLSLIGYFNGYRRYGASLVFGGWGGSSLGVAVFALLALPWLVGLAMRFVDRARSARAAQQAAERDSAQAQEVSRAARGEAAVAQQLAAAAEERAAAAEQLAAQSAEIARLREEQNRLTRDVHDVVGHSLTVILAQAESAQFLADDDIAGLKATMRTVATAARASLQDVRDVLTPGAPRRTPARLAAVLANVAEMNGRDTAISQVGSPRPLPPELDEVACRVLQEMLTNALRHGAASGPLRVELAWPDEGGLADSLRIEVVNDLEMPVSAGGDGAESAGAGGGRTGGEIRSAAGSFAGAASNSGGAPARAGRGIEGMRRRLASVGGRLDVRRRDGVSCAAEGGAGGGVGSATFTAAAIVPVRDVGARAASTEEREPRSTPDLDAGAAVAPATPASTHPAGSGSAPDAPGEDEPISDEAGENAPGVGASADGTPGPEPDMADGRGGEQGGARLQGAADGQSRA